MPIREVHLRSISGANVAECLELRVSEAQTGFVASTAKSLAEAKADPRAVTLAIYDAAVRGVERPTLPMRGFVMYAVVDGVGFINRLLIDQRYQGQGYGKAATLEVIRRLRLTPEVEMIGVSYKRGNETAARLYQSLGFVAWEADWMQALPDEIFLRLPL